MIVWCATVPPISPATRVHRSVALPRRCPWKKTSNSEHVGAEIGGEAGGAGGCPWLMLEDGAAQEDTTALRCDLVRFIATQPLGLQQCCLLLLTHSVAETARVLGHHRSSVYAWLATLREQARTAGLAIYLGVNPTDSVPAE